MRNGLNFIYLFIKRYNLMAMDTNGNLLHMDLNDLSDQTGALHIDNRLILIDNLETPSSGEPDGLSFVNYPVKLSFSIAMIIVSGRVRVRINLENFEAGEGDAIIVLQGNIGEFCHMQPDTRIAVIAFADEFLNIQKHIRTALSIQQLIYSNPVLHLEGKFMEESLDIYRKMKSKLRESDNVFRNEVVQGYIQALLYNTYNYFYKLRQTDSFHISPGSRNQEIYMCFIQTVQKNYMRERNITFYADVLCISPKYLSQVIKNVTGRLAGEWISDYVILEAKALLKTKRYTVQQICDMLNFANQSFFGKYFKRKTGMSPKAYQES